MKRYLLSLFLILSLSAFAQNNQRSLLLISPDQIGNEKVDVAIRISGRQIEIDNKYNRETGVFTPVKIIPITQERLLQALYKKSTQELKNYQKELEAAPCDSLPPVTLIAVEKETETTIEWGMMGNCSPQSMRKIATSLPDIFLKYKD